jgi:hypothetical protein
MTHRIGRARSAPAKSTTRRALSWGRALVVPVVMVFGGVLALVWHGPVEARHNFSMLEVSPQQATSGQEVTVSGFSYTKTAVVRFGALDGPVLARLDPTSNNDIRGVVRIPPDTPPGRHVLFAMHEDDKGTPTRFPGRAAITVSGPGGPPLGVDDEAIVEPRPIGVLEQHSVSPGNLLFVAVATAGGASLLAGVFLVLSARRRSAGETS